MTTRMPVATLDDRAAAVEAAARAISRGQLVILPTDTVYGVAADAFDPDAVRGCWWPRGGAARCPLRCSSATPAPSTR